MAIKIPWAADITHNALVRKQMFPLVGVIDGSDAEPGMIGEFVFLAQADSDAIGCVDQTIVDIASVTVSPGDWDATAGMRLLGSSSSVYDIALWLNPLPGVQPPSDWFAFSRINLGQSGQAGAEAQGTKFLVGPARLNVDTPTMLWLSCQIGFASGTVQVAGSIRARRMR